MVIHKKTNPSEIAPYLTDASNFSGGEADTVWIPETRDEMISILKGNDQPITIAGAGTGLTASRIPLSGAIISMERFNFMGKILNGTVEVGPAISLQNLRSHLQGSSWFYPPNPTESLASLGGTLATNASGARSFKFGPTRDYVLEVDIVLADGRATRVVRGQKIDSPLKFGDGSQCCFPNIKYRSPQCKNAAGYFIQPGMDWLDLFIGSDGTLCIFTQVKLRLMPAPEAFLSGILFMENEDDCWNLVASLKASDSNFISPCSLEYFDVFSLARLKNKFNGIPPHSRAALFFEQDIPLKNDYEACLESWVTFLESRQIMLEDSWFAQNEKDLEKFHDFRHQIPLLLNEENSRLGRVKLGTDMAVSDEHFLDMMHFYRKELTRSGLDYVMFGHIGDNHLHINLLADQNQTELASKTHRILLDQILKYGGTVSAEHGIGKLKKDYYKQMVGPEAIQELKMIKKMLDPEEKLGRGNLL